MKTIAISGIISDFEWEEESNVTPKTLRESLQAAGGEDILVTINSPGGLVYAGLEMYHLLKNYSGNVETRIVSLAASMGSIIALAGDKKSAETTAMYMIHNASTISFGDYRALRKDADTIEQLTGLLASIIENGTTLSGEDTRRLMDEETYFYGDQIKELGFEIVNVENTDNNNSETALAMAASRMESVKNKITKEAQREDMYKAAASIAPAKQKKINYINKIENQPRSGGITPKETSMDLDLLKREHPAVYAEALEAGVNQERDRVKGHLKLGEVSGDMKTALKACREGLGMTNEIQAEYMAAAMNKANINQRQEDDDNAGKAINQPTNEEPGSKSDSEKVVEAVCAKFGKGDL